MEWHSDVNDVTIKVDHDRCVGAAECVDNCPGEVYMLREGKAVAERIDDCIECCTCVSVCPDGAIWHSACD